VTREDFRRELGSVFDAISGSPSPALSDRVRSALADVPERRGPIWIAGLAAAVLAVLLVGVLLVANPLNRLQPQPPVGPASSPSPSASPAPSTSPSAAPSPSASANPTPFACTTGAPATAPNPPLVAFIDRVQTGAHAGYDRLTIEFQNGEPSSIEIKPQSGTSFTMSPSGQPVTLAGQAGILVIIHGSDAHTAYSGPTDITNAYPALVEVRQLEDFEGQTQWGLGLAKPACYRAFMLTNPARLVIDIQVG
jgi:hypothetical protein